MSQPFTRDEAKSAVWAQVEDFELPERIKMLFEVTVDMIRLVLNDAETDEALIDELTEAITAKGTFITDHIDELFANNAKAICDSPLREQVKYVLEQCGEEWFRECLLEEDADEAADRKTALGDNESP